MVEYPTDPQEYLAQIRAQFDRIFPILTELYPNPKSGLNFESPFQLLIATILSAQCTDERVNMVTPALFGRYPTPLALGNAKVDDVEIILNRLGLFRSKARNIVATGKMLVDNYGGEVPAKMEELIKLPGAARKTANVVLGNGFNINVGIPVDTHVMRLSGRLAISKELTPEKIEQDLMKISPQEEWADVSHRLIWHGRKICNARKPNCAACALAIYCPSRQI